MRCVFCHLLIFSYIVTPIVSAKNGGFSTKMCHRDNLDSSFHDPNLTKAERFVKTTDVTLHESTDHFMREVGSTYLMKIGLGTQPYKFFAGFDIGSELTWIQCHPCEYCYPMHQDVFHPTESSKYKAINCLRGQFSCPQFQGMNCVNNACENHITYRDGSFSKGVVSTDVMIIGSKAPHLLIKVKQYVFGCGHYNYGMFFPDQTSIIGLERGWRSLITQLGTNINDNFSYSLFKNIHGKVNFGHNAIVEGHGTNPIFYGRLYGRRLPNLFSGLMLDGWEEMVRSAAISMSAMKLTSVQTKGVFFLSLLSAQLRSA